MRELDPFLEGTQKGDFSFKDRFRNLLRKRFPIVLQEKWKEGEDMDSASIANERVGELW